MRGLLCALLFSLSGIVLSNPTCEECLFLVVEVDYHMSQHDPRVYKHLHDTFCKKEGFDEYRCKYVAGHFVYGMMHVVIETEVDPLKICESAQQCPDKPFMKELVDPRSVTCEDCFIGMTFIWAHLNEPTVKDVMKQTLKGPLYCQNPEADFNRPDDCDRIVDEWFVQMLDETLEFEYHPGLFCGYIGACGEETTLGTTVVTETMTTT